MASEPNGDVTICDKCFAVKSSMCFCDRDNDDDDLSDYDV